MNSFQEWSIQSSALQVSIFQSPFSSWNPRKLFWISWGFSNVQMFFLFPVTPLLKGDFPAGKIDTNTLSFTILQKMHVWHNCSLWAFYWQYSRIHPGQNLLPLGRGRGREWRRHCQEEHLDSRHLLRLLHLHATGFSRPTKDVGWEFPPGGGFIPPLKNFYEGGGDFSPPCRSSY